MYAHAFMVLPGVLLYISKFNEINEHSQKFIYMYLIVEILPKFKAFFLFVQE